MKSLITISIFLVSLSTFSQTYIGTCTSNIEWFEGDKESRDSKEWIGNKVEFYISSVTKSITISQLIGNYSNPWYILSIDRNGDKLFYIDETDQHKIFKFTEYGDYSTNEGELHIYDNKIELLYRQEYGKNSIRTFAIH